MTEHEIIKQAREAILYCQTTVDWRSPAGKEVKKVLDMINEYLKGKQK